jgi:hypothetical protein
VLLLGTGRSGIGLAQQFLKGPRNLLREVFLGVRLGFAAPARIIRQIYKSFRKRVA